MGETRMRERWIFLAVFFGLLILKEPLWLAGAIAALWIVSYHDWQKTNRKVLKAFVLFNLGISLGYIVVAYFKGISPWSYLLYINLKVYAMTYFVFWYFGRINIVAFVSFSRELSYLLTIALSQIVSYKKSFDDFVLAYRSRVLRRMRSREYAFVERVFGFFFAKALHESQERALGMKARGFFDTAK
jgi:cobalt/nickel transport system permease protein